MKTRLIKKALTAALAEEITMISERIAEER